MSTNVVVMNRLYGGFLRLPVYVGLGWPHDHKGDCEKYKHTGCKRNLNRRCSHGYSSSVVELDPQLTMTAFMKNCVSRDGSDENLHLTSPNFFIEPSRPALFVLRNLKRFNSDSLPSTVYA